MLKRIIVLLIVVIFLLGGCESQSIDSSNASDEKKQSLDFILKKHSTENLIKDVDFLIKTIEEVHPDSYAYIDKEVFYKELNNVKSKINKPMNSIEFYKTIAPLVSLIKDGHTNVSIPNDLFDECLTFTGKKQFPLVIEIRDNKIFNKKSMHKEVDIPIGAEILSINDIETERIIKALKKYEIGMREAYKEVKLERDFYFLSWLEYQFLDEYKLTYKHEDSINTVVAEGVSKYKVDSYLKRMYRYSTNYNYEIFDDETCYLDFNSFSDYDSFDKLLGRMFKEINEKNIEKLIIDIRDNGGGNSSLGDLLISYIYNKPFFMYSRVDAKVSKQIVERDNWGDDSQIGEIITYNGTPKYKSDMENRFNGRVCVLSNRYTFSSASDFAMTIKDFNMGRLIGEETGGLATCYGDVYNFSLPNSNLSCGVSYKYFVRPNGDEAPSGVIPDLEVKQNLDDLASEKDTVLDFAKQYIINDYDKDNNTSDSRVINIDFCEIEGEGKNKLISISENLYKSFFDNDYDSIQEVLDDKLKKWLTKDKLIKINSDLSAKFGNIKTVSVSKVNGLKREDKISAYSVEGIINCKKGNLNFSITFDENKKISDIYTK